LELAKRLKAVPLLEEEGTRLMSKLGPTLLAAIIALSTLFGYTPVQASDEVKSIFLITWRGFEEGCEGFQEYLDTRGLKYELTHRDAARDKGSLPGFVEEIKKAKPDLVVTWGTSVSVGILGTYDSVDPEQHVTDIPAVFMFPSNPKRSKLVENYQSSNRNITGVQYVLTEEQQLSIARDSLSFSKMGVLENADELNVVNSVIALKVAATKLGGEILTESIQSSDDAETMRASFKTALEKLKAAGAEVIYFTPSSLLNAHSTTFTETAVSLGLPVFSSGQNPVRNGKAAIGVGVSYRQTGKRAAVLAEKILTGVATPAELSIDEPDEYGLVINMSVVNELDLQISPTIMSIAEIVQN
jgi:putative tryptophan/tyrosine transport system substrate-binding protein